MTDYGFAPSSGETAETATVTINARATSFAGGAGPVLYCKLLLPGPIQSNAMIGQLIPVGLSYADYVFTGNIVSDWGLSPGQLTDTELSDSTFGVSVYGINPNIFVSYTFTLRVDSVHLSVSTVPSTPFVIDTMSPDQTIDEHWPPQRRYAFTY